jgi:hypothetical protein
LDFGDEGGVKLRLNNGRWRWEWANQHHPRELFAQFRAMPQAQTML